MATGDRIYLGSGAGASQTTPPATGQVMTANGWVDFNLGAHADTIAAEVIASSRGGLVDGMYFFNTTYSRIYDYVLSSWRTNGIPIDAEVLGTNAFLPPSQRAVKQYVDSTTASSKEARIGEVYRFTCDPGKTIITGNPNGLAAIYWQDDPKQLPNALVHGNNGPTSRFMSVNSDYLYTVEASVRGATFAPSTYATLGICPGGDWPTVARTRGNTGSIQRIYNGASSAYYVGGNATCNVSGADAFFTVGATHGDNFVTNSESQFGYGYLLVTVIGVAP